MAVHLRATLSDGIYDTFVIDLGELEGGVPQRDKRIQGSHVGTVSPYLRLSPPFLPVGLFIKGAVMEEYTDYGFAMGGANEIAPNIGFTVGLTWGFE